MFLKVLLVVSTPKESSCEWRVSWEAFHAWLASTAREVTAITIAADDDQSPEARAGISEVVARIAAGEFDRIVFYGEQTERVSDASDDVTSPEVNRFAGPWFMALIESIAGDHQVPVVDLRPLTSSFS